MRPSQAPLLLFLSVLSASLLVAESLETGGVFATSDLSPGNWARTTFSVDASDVAFTLHIYVTSTQGAADVYVRHNVQPSIALYTRHATANAATHRTAMLTNTQTASWSGAPFAGTWHVGVHSSGTDSVSARVTLMRHRVTHFPSGAMSVLVSDQLGAGVTHYIAMPKGFRGSRVSAVYREGPSSLGALQPVGLYTPHGLPRAGASSGVLSFPFTDSTPREFSILHEHGGMFGLTGTTPGPAALHPLRDFTLNVTIGDWPELQNGQNNGTLLPGDWMVYDIEALTSEAVVVEGHIDTLENSLGVFLFRNAPAINASHATAVLAQGVGIKSFKTPLLSLGPFITAAIAVHNPGPSTASFRLHAAIHIWGPGIVPLVLLVVSFLTVGTLGVVLFLLRKRCPRFAFSPSALRLPERNIELQPLAAAQDSEPEDDEDASALLPPTDADCSPTDAELLRTQAPAPIPAPSPAPMVAEPEVAEPSEPEIEAEAVVEQGAGLPLPPSPDTEGATGELPPPPEGET